MQIEVGQQIYEDTRERDGVAVIDDVKSASVPVGVEMKTSDEIKPGARCEFLEYYTHNGRGQGNPHEEDLDVVHAGTESRWYVGE